MKLQVRNIQKLLSAIILLIAVGFVGISTMPNAFAATSPTPGATSPIITFGTTTISYTFNAVDGPHRSDEIRVFSPGTSGNIVDGTAISCPTATATSGDYWELRQVGNVGSVGYKLDGLGESVTITFGSGGMPTMFASGGAQIRFSGGDLASDGDFAVEWYKLNAAGVVIGGSGGTDSTAVNGNYPVISCGDEKAGFSATYQVTSSFSVQPPVGGTIIPIDVSALVLAGALTNSIWILPVLGVGAGAAFAVLRYQVTRKEN